MPEIGGKEINLHLVRRKSFLYGKVLEWLKRHAWKACNRRNRFGGSNPPLSAEVF